MKQGSFSMTAEDLIAANRLHWRQTFRFKRAIVLLVTILTASSLWLSWNYGREGIVASLMLSAFLSGAYLLLWLGSWLCVAPLARRAWRQSERMWVDQEVRWTADEIEFVSSRGEVRFPWSDFYRWAADEKTVNLYQSARAFYSLPLRGFYPEARREIASILTAAEVQLR